MLWLARIRSWIPYSIYCSALSGAYTFAECQGTYLDTPISIATCKGNPQHAIVYGEITPTRWPGNTPCSGIERLQNDCPLFVPARELLAIRRPS